MPHTTPDPRSNAALPGPYSGREAAMGKARRKILVVEDDRALRVATTRMLEAEGYVVTGAADGLEGIARAERARFDLVLLDVGLPGLDGLEVLARLRQLAQPPRVVVMTADDTPETMLRAVREQAYDYLTKPFPPNRVPEVVRRALEAAPESLPIEVVSAVPEWVELRVPCALDVAERIQGFMMRLDAALPESVRESVGQAFRELLLNAIEWGGRLDPSRRVTISCVRAKRMLLYRIADPGPGFRFDGLSHAAVSNAAGDPVAHAEVREQKGLRPGGFGILMVRTMVDELVYNEAHNEVVFVKYLD
ncbi:MAG TPA: response regulator [Candidatus Polarisedimenticolia bacterium]|nr:response regulator [Candidatus Polarisedimenticolia bacterium]